MRNFIGISFVAILFFGFGDPFENEVVAQDLRFHPELATELKKMAALDQIAAGVPQGDHRNLSQAEWIAFKEGVFKTNQKRLQQIFDQHGFVGVDLAGREGSRCFWLMVQHSDHVPNFQNEVLEKMKTEVDKDNADPRLYGLLVDRVKLNMGQAQVYGTQVEYNTDTCQAFPKHLADRDQVNQRRQTIGLEPIEEYLNQMTQSHFEMNREFYSKQGITEPKLYK